MQTETKLLQKILQINAKLFPLCKNLNISKTKLVAKVYKPSLVNWRQYGLQSCESNKLIIGNENITVGGANFFLLIFSLSLYCCEHCFGVTVKAVATRVNSKFHSALLHLQVVTIWDLGKLFNLFDLKVLSLKK